MCKEVLFRPESKHYVPSNFDKHFFGSYETNFTDRGVKLVLVATNRNSLKDYRVWLMDQFVQRRTRNPSYSLRAFARDLGVSPTSLSEVIAKKRDLSKKNILKISDRLALSPKLTNALLAQAGLKPDERFEREEFFQLSEDTFNVVSDWYYFAIIDLCKLQSQVLDLQTIAKRLGLSKLETKNAMTRLKRLKLLEEKDGVLIATANNLSTTRDVPSFAIRKYHKQNLQLAEKSIEMDPIELREFSSITIPTDLERLQEAKDMIMDFKRKMARFLETNKSTEVYTLAIQLFPVSRSMK
jgi:plasmid maintenance system antidote protein VapI